MNNMNQTLAEFKKALTIDILNYELCKNLKIEVENLLEMAKTIEEGDEEGLAKLKVASADFVTKLIQFLALSSARANLPLFPCELEDYSGSMPMQMLAAIEDLSGTLNPMPTIDGFNDNITAIEDVLRKRGDLAEIIVITDGDYS